MKKGVKIIRFKRQSSLGLKRKLSPYAIYFLVFGIYCFFSLPFLVSKISPDQIFRKYQTIIVLGGGSNEDCIINKNTQTRMDKAIELYKAKKAPKIILSGGFTTKNCSEAGIMKAYALEQGIPAKSLILEEKSLNTYQNAYYSVALMKQHKMSKAIIVTSDFHVRRANAIFSKYNIFHRMEAAPNAATGIELAFYLFKEQIILCFHAIFGFPKDFGLGLKKPKTANVVKPIVAS